MLYSSVRTYLCMMWHLWSGGKARARSLVSIHPNSSIQSCRECSHTVLLACTGRKPHTHLRLETHPKSKKENRKRKRKKKKGRGGNCDSHFSHSQSTFMNGCICLQLYHEFYSTLYGFFSYILYSIGTKRCSINTCLHVLEIYIKLITITIFLTPNKMNPKKYAKNKFNYLKIRMTSTSY